MTETIFSPQIVFETEFKQDLEMPCHFEGCSNPSEWIEHIKCCDDIYLICQEHFAKRIDQIKRTGNMKGNCPNGGPTLLNKEKFIHERL